MSQFEQVYGVSVYEYERRCIDYNEQFECVNSMIEGLLNSNRRLAEEHQESINSINETYLMQIVSEMDDSLFDVQNKHIEILQSKFVELLKNINSTFYL